MIRKKSLGQIAYEAHMEEPSIGSIPWREWEPYWQKRWEASAQAIVDRIRADTIEECAKALENMECGPGIDPCTVVCCEDEIRALISKDTTEEADAPL